MMPAGITAATSVVPTKATIQVSMKLMTVAEAIEAIIGKARCKISRSPAREGNLMHESYERRLLLDKRGFLVAESLSTVQQRMATVNREEEETVMATQRGVKKTKAVVRKPAQAVRKPAR